MVICYREKSTGKEHWSLVKARPIFDETGSVSLVVNIFDDITRQKLGELAQRFLSEASMALSASLDYESMLDNVSHLAVPALADICIIDILDETGSVKHVTAAHADPLEIEVVEEMRRRYPEDIGAPLGVGAVIRTGKREFHAEVTEDVLRALATDDEHVAMLRSLGFRSLLILPMAARGRTIGAITLARTQARSRRFGDDDVEIAEEFARRVAVGAENAWLYAERSHIAHTLQASLLPPVLPDVPGVEVAARFRPAGQGFEVGGDFYDIFNTGGAGWAVVIGDVCGKGPEAAALTGLARYTLRTAAMQEVDPSRVLSLLSEAIMQQRSDTQFCTATYGRLELEPVGAQLTVSSGGHPLPLVIPGTLLGVVHDAELADQRVELAPGSSLVFYTDGVIEAGEPRGSFGLGGLTSLLQSCSGLSAEEIASRMENAVVGLEPEPTDDVAFLVLRIRE
jgi:serine phosphatase RsbU (regulator of sigma subunit)